MCHLLNHVVVAVLVGDVEGALDFATVGVSSRAVEYLFVVFNVVQVDGSVKSQQNHLGSLNTNRIVFELAGWKTFN
jgi:hypothetical protein